MRLAEFRFWGRKRLIIDRLLGNGVGCGDIERSERMGTSQGGRSCSHGTSPIWVGV